MGAVIEPTDEMRAAFLAEREDTCDQIGCGQPECLDVRLAAVLALVERDRCLEARGHVFHPLRKWPSGRGGSHPHYCVSCSDGTGPGPGCIDCRSTGMDQTPWPRCQECRR